MGAKFLPVPSKLLLFGEHTVLLGSPALTMPLWKFCARLRIPGADYTDETLESTAWLKEFYNYLNEHPDWFDGHLHLRHIKDSLKRKMYLESQIPIGYGLGSSASVCVAVYKVFGKTNLKEPSVLKLLYSRMESFFHGKSSGMDPLAIHFNQPVLVDQGRVNFLEQSHKLIDDDIHIYLLDSGIARNAGAMIELFQEEMQSLEFKNPFQQKYLPILETIKERAASQLSVDWKLIKALSDQQLTLFHKLIPEPVSEVWKQTSKSDHTCIKVLGAGGGGFFLVFSKKEITELQGYKLIAI